LEKLQGLIEEETQAAGGLGEILSLGLAEGGLQDLRIVEVERFFSFQWPLVSGTVIRGSRGCLTEVNSVFDDGTMGGSTTRSRIGEFALLDNNGSPRG
jgi:hypothetical protein